METSKLVDSVLFLYSPFKATDNICLNLPEGSQSFIKRSDNKSIFTIDEDNYINGKSKWVELKYPITQKIWKCNSIIHVNNDKDLEKGLYKIFSKCNFWEEEIKVLTVLWTSKLQKLDTQFFKCEVYYNEKVDKFFPLTVDKPVAYRNRTLVKFIPVDKKGKDVVEAKEFIARSGDLRLVEFIGYVEE